MKIFIGSDHAGFEYKKEIIEWLKDKYEIEDIGPHKYNPKDDYPVYSFSVAQKVSKSKNSAGIIIARSGIGEVVAANKVRGVRAVSFLGKPKKQFLEMSRIHDDTNVLCMGSDFVSLRNAKKAISIWLETKFEGGTRHKRRLREISEFESKNWKGK